jgi:hypothetical protein
VQRDNIITGQAVKPAFPNVEPLPSSSPPNGTYWVRIEAAAPAFVPGATTEKVGLTVAPQCGPGATCNGPGYQSTFTLDLDADTRTVYPLLLHGGISYITGPLWPVAGLATTWAALPGASIRADPSAFSTEGETPWYIPGFIAGTSFETGLNESAQLTFANGAVKQVAQYAQLASGKN